MLFPPDDSSFTSTPRPEEATHQTYPHPQDRPHDTAGNPPSPADWQAMQFLIFQMQEQMQHQLLEMQRQMYNLEKRSHDRHRVSFSMPEASNTYSPGMQLGFILIKSLFLLFMGFAVIFVLLYLLNHASGVDSLLNLASKAFSPLCGLAFGVLTTVVVFESLRN